MKSVFLVILFLNLSFAIFPEVPQVVKDTFKLKYLNATDVQWVKDSEKEWTAEFKMHGKDMSATFDPKGVWLESETVISLDELPIAVKNAFIRKYKMSSDLLIVKVESKDEGLLYEFGFGKSDIFYHSDGTEYK